MALPGTSQPNRVGPTGATIAPPSEPDWPIQATDQIVRVVDNVRDKTTGPALNAARWATYGLVLVALSIPLFFLLVIGVVRALEGFLLQVQSWTSQAWLHDPVWLVYLVLGVICTLTGMITWRKGKPASPPS